METDHRLKGTIKYNQFCTSLTNALHDQNVIWDKKLVTCHKT